MNYGNRTLRKLLLKAGAAGLAITTAQAGHATVAIDFDTLKNDELVDDYYNGGSGSLGSTGGPNYGISFVNALVLDETPNNEANLKSPPNSITFLDGVGSIMNVAAGFDTGFSFNYSAPFYVGVVDVFDGLNGTGNLLASITLPLTSNGAGDPSCGGKAYCPDYATGVNFSGIAKSVNFSGTANFIVYDDITLGSSTPVVTGAAPEPSTWALLLFGMGSVGAALRSRKRQGPLAIA